MAITHGNFTGTSPIALAASGLPAGVTFTDNADGSWTLGGTWPAPGTYPYTVTATNAAGSTPVAGNQLISTAPPSVSIIDCGTTFTSPTQPCVFSVTAVGSGPMTGIVWTVTPATGGTWTIVSGQGTDTITVSATGVAFGSSIDANISISAVIDGTPVSDGPCFTTFERV